MPKMVDSPKEIMSKRCCKLKRGFSRFPYSSLLVTTMFWECQWLPSGCFHIYGYLYFQLPISINIDERFISQLARGHLFTLCEPNWVFLWEWAVVLNKWAIKGEAADRTGAGSVRMIFRARQLARVVPNLGLTLCLEG